MQPLTSWRLTPHLFALTTLCLCLATLSVQRPTWAQASRSTPDLSFDPIQGLGTSDAASEDPQVSLTYKIATAVNKALVLCVDIKRQNELLVPDLKLCKSDLDDCGRQYVELKEAKSTDWLGVPGWAWALIGAGAGAVAGVVVVVGVSK